MKLIKKILLLTILVIPFFLGMKDVNASWTLYNLGYQGDGATYCLLDSEMKPLIRDYLMSWETQKSYYCEAKGGIVIELSGTGDSKGTCIGQNYHWTERDYVINYMTRSCFYTYKSQDETYNLCIIDRTEEPLTVGINQSCPNNYWSYKSTPHQCRKCVGTTYSSSNFKTESAKINTKIMNEVVGKSFYYELANKTKACQITNSSSISEVCNYTEGFYYVNTEIDPQILVGFKEKEACVNYETGEIQLIKTYSTDEKISLYGGFFDYAIDDYSPYYSSPEFNRKGEKTCDDNSIRKGASCYSCNWVDVESEDIIGYTYNKFDCGVISDYINKAWTIILIAAPVMAILFSAFDVFKMVVAGEEKEMKKQFDRIVKRLVIMAILIILPLIVNMVMGVVKFDKLDACMSWKNYRLEEKPANYISSCPEGKFLGLDPYEETMACFDSQKDLDDIQEYYDRGEPRPNIQTANATYEIIK